MQGRLNRRGFTLVEIVIILAIVGLLAFIAVPNVLRLQINTNENDVKSALRNFSSAAEIFRAAQNPPTYPASIAVLTGSVPAYLDVSWTGTKHGYHFSYAVPVAPSNTYSLLAVPLKAGRTAINIYCIDQSGVIVGSINGGNAPTADAAGCAGGAAITG